MNFKKSELTELEIAVVEALEGSDEYNGYPYSCVADLAEQIGKSTKVTRGVVASLVRKEVVQVEDCVSGCPPFVLLTGTEEVTQTPLERMDEQLTELLGPNPNKPSTEDVNIILAIMRNTSYGYSNADGGPWGEMTWGESKFKVSAMAYEKAWCINELLREDLNPDTVFEVKFKLFNSKNNG